MSREKMVVKDMWMVKMYLGPLFNTMDFTMDYLLSFFHHSRFATGLARSLA